MVSHESGVQLDRLFLYAQMLSFMTQYHASLLLQQPRDVDD